MNSSAEKVDDLPGLADPSDVVVRAFLAAFEPPPRMTVSEWADRYRMVTSTHSPDAGPYETAKTPYVREIADCLSVTHPAKYVILQKGSQIGGSEIGNNWLGYLAHQAPGPILCIYPRHSDAKDESRSRIDPMIELTDPLRQIFGAPDTRRGRNTTLWKAFPGGSLRMIGANSAAGLRRISIRYLFCDDLDGFPRELKGEGSPVALAVKRTSAFEGRNKIFLCSTPTVTGFSAIEEEYKLSDQRVLQVPCLHCGSFFQILWARIWWPENGSPDDAELECPDCKGHMREHQKLQLLSAAHWEAQAPGDGERVGFHLSALYSPMFTWAAAAKELLLARAKGPESIQTWTNTVLAETYQNEEDSVDPEDLFRRRESYPARVPSGALVLTAGVDVNADWLEMEVVGWGHGEESWGVDHRIFHGDPDRDEVWTRLAEALEEQYEHEDGYKLRIEHACVDSGYRTQRVYRFCRAREARGIFAAKGVEGPARPIVSSSMKKRTGNARRPLKLFLVGTDQARSTIRKRLTITEEGAGYCHFPRGHGYTPEFFRQLTSMICVPKHRRGVKYMVWDLPRGARKEAFDCRILAYAAMLVRDPAWQPLAVNRAKKAARVKPAAASDVAPQKVAEAPQRRAAKRPKRGGWVSGWRE